MRKIILINFLVLAFLILCIEAFSFSYLRLVVEKKRLSIAAGNAFVADIYSSKRRLLQKYKKLTKEGSNVFFFQTFYDVNNWTTQEGIPQGCEAFNDSQKFYLQNPGNTTIVFGEESDGVITYVTDRFGFRNPPDQVDRSKVLFVGDSFTEGSFVPDNNVIARRLTDLGMPSYNGGRGGMGLGYFSAAAKELSRFVNPEVIVVNVMAGASVDRFLQNSNPIFINTKYNCEVDYGLSNSSDYPSNEVLLRNQVGKAVDKIITQGEKISIKVGFVEQFKNLIRKTNTYLAFRGLSNYEYLGEGFPKCEKIKNNSKNIDKVFSEFSRTAEASNALLVFNYLPIDFNYSADYSQTYHDKLRSAAACEKSVLIKSIEEQVSGKYLFLDNLDIFYSYNENNAEIRKLYFADNFNSPRGLEGRWRGHYSQKGYEIVAQNLLKNISNGLSE